MIQAVVSPDRAFIIADTICGSVGTGIMHDGFGRPAEVSKLQPIPHARCVMASVGNLLLRLQLERVPNAIDDFDRCVHTLPPVLRSLYGQVARRSPLGETILLIGWSTQRGRMACAVFNSIDDFEAEVHGDPVGGGTTVWRHPDLPRGKYQWLPINAAELIAFAHATSEHYRGIDPTTPIGGKLILAELTEQAVTLSVAGDLGMPMD